MSRARSDRPALDRPLPPSGRHGIGLAGSPRERMFESDPASGVIFHTANVLDEQRIGEVQE